MRICSHKDRLPGTTLKGKTHNITRFIVQQQQNTEVMIMKVMDKFSWTYVERIWKQKKMMLMYRPKRKYNSRNTARARKGKAIRESNGKIDADKLSACTYYQVLALRLIVMSFSGPYNQQVETIINQYLDYSFFQVQRGFLKHVHLHPSPPTSPTLHHDFNLNWTVSN